MAVPPLVAFSVCTLIWGTTWIAIKIGYEGLDAVWGASLRFFVAGALMVPILLLGRHALPRGRRQVLVGLAVGLLLFCAYYGLPYWGEQWLPSGFTAVLFGTMPLFVAVATAALIPHERVTRRQLAGVLVGLLGLGIVFGDELRSGGATVGPLLAIVGSAIAAAISSVIVRRWGRDLSPTSLNTFAMLVGATALLGASLLLGERPTLPATDRAWASVVFLAVLGSVVSFLLYWDLLKKWGAQRTSLIVLLTPIVAVVTGLAVGERLTAWQWVGSATVLAGVGVSLYTPAVPTAAAAVLAGEPRE